MRDGSFFRDKVKPGEDHERAVGSGVGVGPGWGKGGIEEIRHHSVGVARPVQFRLDLPGTVKLGETLELVARQSAEEIQKGKATGRGRNSKQGTD